MIDTPNNMKNSSLKFAHAMSVAREQNRTFTSCVRREYKRIEDAIQDGISLAEICKNLSDAYCVKGSLPGLKSALRRIRVAEAGAAQARWLDRNAPLPGGNSQATGWGSNQAWCNHPQTAQQTNWQSTSNAQPQQWGANLANRELAPDTPPLHTWNVPFAHVLPSRSQDPASAEQAPNIQRL